MTSKHFRIEVCLASMMRVPLPRALRFGTLYASVHLMPFKTKKQQGRLRAFRREIMVVTFFA